jgi:uroporphyrinogen-III synthase
MEQISILSTKTLSGIQRKAVLDANFDLLEQDFIEVTNTPFSLQNIQENLIFSSQNAVLSLIEQDGWEGLRTKTAFCVGIKTKEILEQNGFTVDVYMDYASELAEIITLIYSQNSYTFFSGNLRKETLPQALKDAGIVFNEIEVYQTTLTPFKISSQEKFDGILFFSPSAVESYFTNNTIQDEVCFCIGTTTASSLESKKIKNIIIPELPIIEEVIEEVIAYYKES